MRLQVSQRGGARLLCHRLLNGGLIGPPIDAC